MKYIYFALLVFFYYEYVQFYNGYYIPNKLLHVMFWFMLVFWFIKWRNKAKESRGKE